MTRDFCINGETLVKVKFGAHVSGVKLRELGLAAEEVRVIPKFYHSDIRVDDFGPNVPPEVLWMLAEVRISMTLINYDPNVLDVCISESMGGVSPLRDAGTLAPAGTLMGGGGLIFGSGYHFISLNLLSPQLGNPWRFRASYLADLPVQIPLGTKTTLADCQWRAIPYQPLITKGTALTTSGAVTVTTINEIISSGAILWDRFPDDQ